MQTSGEGWGKGKEVVREEGQAVKGRQLTAR